MLVGPLRIGGLIFIVYFIYLIFILYFIQFICSYINETIEE